MIKVIECFHVQIVLLFKCFFTQDLVGIIINTVVEHHQI